MVILYTLIKIIGRSQKLMFVKYREGVKLHDRTSIIHYNSQKRLDAGA